MRQLHLHRMYHRHRLPAQLGQDYRDLCRGPVRPRSVSQVKPLCFFIVASQPTPDRDDQHLWRAHPQVPEQCFCMVARARHDLARHRHPRRGAEAPERQVRLPDVHRRDWRRRRRLVGAREPRLRLSDRHSHGSVHANRSVRRTLFFLKIFIYMIGFDASAHMTEETHNAAMAGSIGIVMSIGVSAILGWFLLLGLLFSIQDYDNTIASPTGQPVTQIFLDTVGQNGAIVLMVSVASRRARTKCQIR